jgi:hypothetical protein
MCWTQSHTSSTICNKLDEYPQLKPKAELASWCLNCTSSISPFPFRPTFSCVSVEPRLLYLRLVRHGSRGPWLLVVTADLNSVLFLEKAPGLSSFTIHVLYGSVSWAIFVARSLLRGHSTVPRRSYEFSDGFPGRGLPDSRLFDVCVSLFPYVRRRCCRICVALLPCFVQLLPLNAIETASYVR